MSCTDRLRAAVVLAVAVAAGHAQAALGEPATSVAAEQAQLHAARRQTFGPQVQVHTLQWADGSQVRQYAGPDGRIYAVAWNTRGKPQLSLLLGSHYDRYVAAVRAAQRARPGVRHAGQWQDGELVVEAVAHGTVFSGRAYLSTMIPPGQGRDAIR